VIRARILLPTTTSPPTPLNRVTITSVTFTPEMWTTSSSGKGHDDDDLKENLQSVCWVWWVLWRVFG
jgi:hypothetical protein